MHNNKKKTGLMGENEVQDMILKNFISATYIKNIETY